ncbi:MAG: hypothetical protein CL843_03850 [Crocinitomicaceae bacterium]|nr:hypothetical protein [Crocinitomicaceae bacterium]|tara:strand:- start:2803 stop:4146 length:1344 start_codon:yes stop_codon:yes gene_type:complete
MKHFYLFLTFVATTTTIFAQSGNNNYDVAKVMTYNLLNYRNSTSYCNATSNDPDTKDEYLKKIIQYADPDIVCFNEVGSNSSNIGKLYNNVMNTDGVTKYGYSNYSSTSSSSLMNVTFYNTEMFEIYNQTSITKALNNSNLVRLIDVITFYFSGDPNLDTSNDTTFLTLFVAHLKAGSTSSDQSDRAAATAAVMDYIENHPEISENFMIAGDFNIYDASDDEFQNLISGDDDKRFYDPANAIGEWDANSNYANMHTQSTRHSSATNNGCFSGGGLDNRFDFILTSEAIIDGSGRVEYGSNSYTTIGQDGQHFNSSVNYGTNNSASSDIIEAVYNISDHLPVTLGMYMYHTIGTSTETINNDLNKEVTIHTQNPVRTDNIVLNINSQTTGERTLEVYDITGKALYARKIQFSKGTQQVNIDEKFPSGILLIKLQEENKNPLILKLVKI